MNLTYEQNGIFLSKKIIREETELEIVYKGLLFKSGADTTVMRIGYNENWDHEEDVLMEKSEDCFKTKIKVASSSSLNFVFRDSAFNWDNNSGENYNVKVYKKLIRKNTKTNKKKKSKK